MTALQVKLLRRFSLRIPTGHLPRYTRLPVPVPANLPAAAMRWHAHQPLCAGTLKTPFFFGEHIYKPLYQRRFNEQMFVKPVVSFTLFERVMSATLDTQSTLKASPLERCPVGFKVKAAHAAHGRPLLVLYGSDGGSTHAYAQQFSMRARSLGFEPCLLPMNDMCDLTAVARAAKCVVVLSATYNGLPPDEACKFMEALKVAEGSHAQPFREVAYAVFGCGNTEWEATYQAVPKMIDAQFATLGARRLLSRGVGNSAGDIDLHFASWNEAVWPLLAESASIELSLEVLAPGTSWP